MLELRRLAELEKAPRCQRYLFLTRGMVAGAGPRISIRCPPMAACCLLAGRFSGKAGRSDVGRRLWAYRWR